MKTIWLITNYVVIVVVLCVSLWSEAAGSNGMPQVNIIEIEGLGRIDWNVVREKVMQQQGEALSPETVSDDIKAVFELGYFQNVRAEIEPFEGGIKLIYIVREKPTIRMVEVFGNRKLDDDQIRDKITITPGAIEDTVLIQRNADSIRSLYGEKGFALATVVPVITEIDEGHVLLTYQISEGPKVRIKEIEIDGNQEISDFRVRWAMETSKWWMFSWLTSGGHYEKAVLSEDLRKIRNLYHDNGFIQAHVSEPEILVTKDRRTMTISVEIDEGEQFNVSSIEFKGNDVFADEELMQIVKTIPGTPISKKILDKDVANLTDMYTEKGYALANIYPDIVPDIEEKSVKIRFVIYERGIFEVGRIDISGNLKTRDKVIRREIRLNEGDVFNGKLLKRSYQRIYNLKFFEEVKLKTVPNIKDSTLDIDMEIKERSTGSLNAGVGYSSEDKFLGMFEVTLGNLGGRGQYLRLKSEFSSSSTNFELSFREPWLFDRQISFNTSIYRVEKEYTDYEKKAEGFTVGLGKGFLEYWSANATYGYENATIFNIEETASDYMKEQEGTRVTSSISPSLVRDTRDNFLNPHKGSRNGVYLKYAGLGGDNRYYKVALDSRWFLPVSESTHFSVRGRHSFAGGYSGDKLPLYERYRVGGGRTVRGLRDVGPRDESDIYIGGLRRMLFNLEYSFPLIREANLRGGIFYDIGCAYNTSEDLDMRDSAGVGARWMSPIGPIAIDWARNLHPYAGEPNVRWEFTLGTFF
jgi:outer membrane protein insertion porin family